MKKLYVRAETAEDHESVSVRESSLLQATQDYKPEWSVAIIRILATVL